MEFTLKIIHHLTSGTLRLYTHVSYYDVFHGFINLQNLFA